VETRHAAFEPSGKGSPNGADAFRPDSAVSSESEGAAPSITPLLSPEDVPLTAEDCAIGEVIADKYLIEGVIGRGSMGVVVRATHLGFDELVALKFIRPEMREIDGILSRFAREAKASVRIRNEHAVNVLDVGVADPIGPFFVMEYLEGLNLEELVDSQGAFDAPTAVKYVLEACEALAAAHAQGIIHRDIKPQNIFLAWQGRLELIKLLDFGISKGVSSGQMFGDDLSSREQDWVMGTPLYMSPEQLRHAPDVDERTDIWSLGAVLYELLCGEPLFSGDTQTQVCRQVLEVDSRPVRMPIPGVPEELWDIIERCLSLDKEHRYGNVAELGEALLPFAPNGSFLHVERARALLGLRPLDLFEGEDEIEDIDVDPIEEPEALASPPPVAVAVAPPPSGEQPGRRPSWVELAIPALACAVVALAIVQLRMSFAQSSESAIQTAAFALRGERVCPAPSAPSRALEPTSSARPVSPVPSTGAVVPADGLSPEAAMATAGDVQTGAAPAAATANAVTAAPASPAPAASTSAASPRGAAAQASGASAAQAQAPAAAAVGSASSNLTAPGAAAPASPAAAAAVPAPTSPESSAPSRAQAAAPSQAVATPAQAATASASARTDDRGRQHVARSLTAQEAKPAPKLEFRLIDERPLGEPRPASSPATPLPPEPR
jgi:eukaryotic-like serine/threonine-protein kinase